MSRCLCGKSLPFRHFRPLGPLFALFFRTNADKGVLFTWSVTYGGGCSYEVFYFSTGNTDDVGCFPTTFDAKLTDTSTGITTSTGNNIPAPVLQAQDGTFIGNVMDGNEFIPSLAAFNPDGSVKWVGPVNAQALLTTSDGGVIARTDSGQFLAFDQSGSVVGQFATLPTLSWKGAYQMGSLDSVVPPDFALATTFAAARGPISLIATGFLENAIDPSPSGNLTGNGFSLVTHTFGIVFCGPGFQIGDVWHGGDGPCPANLPDANFAYIPAIDDNNNTCPNGTGLPCTPDFSHDNPTWADTIKIQALNWYKAAFDHFPVLIANKKQPSMLFGGSSNPTSFEHTIYVRGDWVRKGEQPRGDLSSPPTGWTPLNLTGLTNASFVYYLPIMGSAQTELGSPGTGNNPYQYLRPPYPPVTPKGLADFQTLVTGIGTAIGNVAAHETGHQLNVPNMECSFSTCEDHNVYLYQFESTDTWSFTGQPKMSWGTAGTCWIENFIIPDSCKK